MRALSPPPGNMMNRFLDIVERGGNILPHPASLFALMALLVVILSGIAASFDLTARHPGTGEMLKAVSLLNGAGLRLMVDKMVTNFTSFAPLGTVLVAFMGSASAKWAIMAPVFIPMFMLLGYTPEFTQVAYRIGDSTTNIIAPMMTYFALIIAFVQRYQKDAGIGTVVATMLPYTFTFMLAWCVLLVIWMLLGLPVGPGAAMHWP